jgi:hypothetical protein
MQVSSSSGYQLLNQSNRLVEQAATDIQAKTVSKPSNDAVALGAETKLDATKSASPLPSADPLINLNQAHQYAKVGANIIQREQEMIGTLLDTRV